MKKASVLVLIMGMALFTTIPLVYSQDVKMDKIPFPANFYRLSHYLELSNYQLEEVYKINSFFIDQQKEYLQGTSSLKTKQKDFQQILFGNLKLMKEALNQEQYKKYLSLINVTYHNRLAETTIPPEVYLAMQLQKEQE